MADGPNSVHCYLLVGLKGGKREEVQQEWMDGKVAVICATISFGMGVDKANVRWDSVTKLSVSAFISQ